MYLEQPTKSITHAYYPCNESKLASWQPDGTPVVCTHGGLFYVMGSLGSDYLSSKINQQAKAGQQFITVYGGLRWTTTTGNTKNTSLYSQ